MSNKQGFIIIFLYCQGNIWKYRKFNGYKAGKTRHWAKKSRQPFVLVAFMRYVCNG